jgi:hypothetical protein
VLAYILSSSPLLTRLHKIKRASELCIPGRNQMQIDHCRIYGGVDEQLADGIEVVPFIELVGGEAVAIMPSSA